MVAKRSVLVLALTFLSAFALLGSASAEPLSENADFTELARRGFAEVINSAGQFIKPNVTNPQGQGNNYSWAMLEWLGRLYVGTAADVGCANNSGSGGAIVGTCPPPSLINGQEVTIPLAAQRPEIWRYTPVGTGADATRGTWERVFQSPLTSILDVSPSIPLPILACLSDPILCDEIFTRDFGYRSMILCDAGGTERLYATTFGLGPRLLWTENGTTWTQASTVGLPNSDLNTTDPNFGFRAVACKDGGLWVSPAGTSTNTDESVDPRVFFNPNPTNLNSAWRAISPAGVCDPNLANTFSVFNLEVFNGAVYAGVANDVIGGMVCKATGCDRNANGTLQNPQNPATCTATWTMTVPPGTGRGNAAEDNLPMNGGTIRMKTFKDQNNIDQGLYVGLGRSAGDAVPAELIRVNPSDTWDLIMGKDRLLTTMQALTPNTFNCNNDPGGGGPVDATKCFPLSHQGPGFGGGWSANASQSFCNGKDVYVWSFAQVDSDGDNIPELYTGTLEVGGGNFGVGGIGTACTSNSSNPDGFDLWRSNDGTTFSAVSLNGLGNSNAGGIRNLAGVQGVGLFVGSQNADTNVGILDPLVNPADPLSIQISNPDAGGLQVWLGTCAPGPGPLVADAGSDTRFFDNGVSPDTTAADGKVTASLDGSRSVNRFCGQPISSYQWYMGSFSANADNCATPTLTPALPGGTTAKVGGLILCTLGPGADLVNCLQHPSPNIQTDFTEYPFTLQVIAPDGTPNPSCDEVVIRASTNLPPTATISSTTPQFCTSGGGAKRVTVLNTNGAVDSVGELIASLTLNGTCADADGQLNATNSCVWSTPLPLGPLPGPWFNPNPPTCNGPPCTTTSTTATVAEAQGFGGGGGGAACPSGNALNILLIATDDHGNQKSDTIAVAVRASRHDLALGPSPAITTAAPALQGIAQLVTVKVRNSGDFQETFNVTLQDPGGTVTPVSAQPITLASCLNLNPCPSNNSANATFNWTPTTASVHTLTGTAVTPAGVTESSTTNNVATLQVQVDLTPVLVAAVLPSSRSVKVGGVASAFGLIHNAGPVTALQCGIGPGTPPVAATFSYQTTVCATNAATGPPNTPVDIAAGQNGCFIFFFTPSAAFAPTDVQLSFDCTNANPVTPILGVNTLNLSASDNDVLDIVAVAGTILPDGIVHIPGNTGTGVFVVATSNVSVVVGGNITASADTGGVSLPVTITICETDPDTSVCTNPVTPAASATANVTAGGTNTFGIFVQGNGNITPDAATKRIFVRFRDSGNVIRGSTSVAVQTN